jgi:hypothetical protein
MILSKLENFYSQCRERAVTVPKFAEGKSKFVFGESYSIKINQAPLDSKERSKPVPYMGFSKPHKYMIFCVRNVRPRRSAESHAV